MFPYERLPEIFHSKVDELKILEDKIHSDDYLEQVKELLKDDTELKIYLSLFIEYVMEEKIYLQSAHHLFFLFTYLPLHEIQMYMDYLFPHCGEEGQEIIQKRFLIFIYLKMMKSYQEWKRQTISHESFEEEYQSYHAFISHGYEKKYLTNPLFVENPEEVPIPFDRVSLFDLFVHASYLIEYRELAALILSQMMESGRYTKEEYIGLFQSNVQVDVLGLLDSFCKNIYDDFLGELEEELERYPFYIYSFFFFFNDFIKEEEDKEKRLRFCSSLVHMAEQQVPLVHITSNTCLNIRDIEVFLANMLSLYGDECVAIIDSLIQHLDHSSYVSVYNHIYITTMWLRLIDYKLNHNQKSEIFYNKSDGFYYMITPRSGVKIKIDIENYIAYIREYLESVSPVVAHYLQKYISHYVNHLYPMVKAEEEKMVGAECVICMEEIKKDEGSHCSKCKHCFHQTCIKELFTSHHFHCPLCRSSLYNTMLINLDVRYQLFSKIVER